jgi:ATP-dependent protease Clp ATPase subunit
MRLNMSQVYFLCSFDHCGATINEDILRIEALGAVARKAIERKTGARDLRSILESIEFALSSMIISFYAVLTRLHEELRTACLQILRESRRVSRRHMAFSGRPTPLW